MSVVSAKGADESARRIVGRLWVASRRSSRRARADVPQGSTPASFAARTTPSHVDMTSSINRWNSGPVGAGGQFSKRPVETSMFDASKWRRASSVVVKILVAVSVMKGDGGFFGFHTT